MLNDSATATAPLTDEERAAIHEQLERLLSNSHFKQSRRFPSFLRFVIDQTLQGQTDLLKERTLGIEIFGREADYDTASDPIVRVTATEIRKRIAQYYQEPGHETELRVSLPAGSYIPQFHWPQAPRETSHTEMVVASPPSVLAEPLEVQTVPELTQRGFWRPATLGILAVVLCAAAVYLWHSAQRSAFDFFWGPLIKSSDPVLFCVADQSRYSTITLRDAADPSRQTQLQDNLTAIIIDDLNPIVRVAGLLQSNGKKYTLKGEGTTNLMDLRNGPTVFIGAFDNAWTLRLTAPLRYHFANNPDMTDFAIVDSTKPGQPGWVVNRFQQMTTNNYRDYAIVARFTDSTTGKLAVVAAGVARGGTRVATEYLTDPADLAQLERAAGGKKNMEVVLSTQIIDGEPGTPKVEASYFW
ncbi:MAG: hypothetical protein ABSC65_10385 [Acidobacteriaceae bacterium]|jgi:hypothetical protein